MMEVTVSKRRRSWEWRVHDQNGMLVIHGRERTRPAARYEGYRHLFMLLAVGRRSAPVRWVGAVKQRDAARSVQR